MTAGVSQPLAHAGIQMRTSVHRDDTRLVDLLLHDRYEPGSLHDFKAIVVARWKAWQRTAHDTARIYIDSSGPLYGPSVRTLSFRSDALCRPSGVSGGLRPSGGS